MGSVAENLYIDEKVSGDANSGSSEDRHVKRLLDQISKTLLVEEKKTAIVELVFAVWSSTGQMAFGETGFHVILSILKEKPNDVQMVQNALETLLMAVTPTNYAKGPSDEVPPNLINSNLLLSEKENISILLSLLSHEDIHVRYDTLQLLMPPLNKSPQKLLEVICSIPSGIKQLLNFLNDDCKLLRNEAMTFLTFLNCEAEEIQELLAFEGAFVKIFSIIEDEGGLEGGVVVQVWTSVLLSLSLKYIL